MGLILEAPQGCRCGWKGTRRRANADRPRPQSSGVIANPQSPGCLCFPSRSRELLLLSPLAPEGGGEQAGDADPGQRQPAAVGGRPQVRAAGVGAATEVAMRAVIAGNRLPKVVGAVGILRHIGLLGLVAGPRQIPVRQLRHELIGWMATEVDKPTFNSRRS
jgi:hypothetical protein